MSGILTSTEEPKVEEPKAEEPKAEEPKAEEPKVEEPKAEEPKAEEPKAEGVPKTKLTSFKVPDNVELNDDLISKFKSLAEEMKLTQEDAQEMLNLQFDWQASVRSQMDDERNVAQDQWANDAKVDAEYGGDKFEENVAIARRVLDKFGNPKLIEVIDSTRVGNNPELIRFLVRVGKSMQESNSFENGKWRPTIEDTLDFRYNATK